MKITRKSISGTSYHFIDFRATLQHLLKVLGEATDRNVDKTQYQWELETADGSVFTLYDYKNYQEIQPDTTIDWHIGAHDAQTAQKALLELQAA